MKIFITGASGYLGSKLAMALAEKGCQVHALIRSGKDKKYLQHPNIKIFKGDILDSDSLNMAMKECKQVYHAAGYVNPRATDSSIYYRVNVEGTRNVLNAAIENAVDKMVFTSTCGVIGYSLSNPLQEENEQTNHVFSDYDASKKLAEDLVLSYTYKGLNAVIVRPAKVFGPGNISHSLTTNAVIKRFLEKGFTLVPSPGSFKVCFAYIDDVVTGHILAMEKGECGDKYNLGGINISYVDFFRRVRFLSSGKGYIIHISKYILKPIALLLRIIYRFSGKLPSFSAKNVEYIFHDYIFSSQKAMDKLGYSITPLDIALHKTIQYLENTE